MNLRHTIQRREWEHKRLKMIIADLKRHLLDVQAVKVSYRIVKIIRTTTTKMIKRMFWSSFKTLK